MTVISRQSSVASHESSVASHESRVEIPQALTRRVVIEHIEPEIEGGRFPIKRTTGETVEVTADIFADGHDVLVAVLRDRHAQGSGTRDSGFASAQITNLESQIPSAWRETPMTLVAAGTDAWTARFAVGAVGWHDYQIVGWVDRFLTWRHDLAVKAENGQDVSVELLEGSLIVREAAARAEQIGSGQPDATRLLERADALSDSSLAADRIAAGLSDELLALMAIYADRSRATASETRRVWVDRERARFGAWYEMFPRSAGPNASRSGTFREAAGQLPRIADLGFDIVYLPPIHPIGASFRKGPNNSLIVRPGDPGSPWAIGSEAGGHTAVEPGLGTIVDFEMFRGEAERLGLEVALDLAWQCSPDHPWVAAHPQWFRHRPDGTIKYAENPPKKYQDIYPLDFGCDDWRSLWQALLDVTLFWIGRGVRVFRVDNPHTKTLGFWAWMIDEVRRTCPDAIFLAEAFTRPKPMRYLAKSGFTQSYTYFTWRNTKAELVDYFTELTAGDSLDVLRPNLFANTPDILHAYLQHGGRPAFEARLLLAATLGASYGIYSGFELCESRALAPGSEEYADSEKYQYRQRDWNRPGNIAELVRRVNDIRRRHRALQFDRTLRFCDTDNPEIIAYTKTAPDGSDRVLIVVNLDPHHMQHGHVHAGSYGADAGDSYPVHDLLDDATYVWRGEWNYVRLDPGARQGHIMVLPE
jgi:starch synthase (maltosyl-transferring)